MESETNCMIDQNALPLPIDSSIDNLQLELLDEIFCIDNFEHLDDQFLSSCDGIQFHGFDDPFDPFCHGSSLSFDLCDFNMLFEDNDIIANQSFQSDGVMNFENNMEIGMALSCHDPYNMHFNIGAPDEISFVTANEIGGIGSHKKDSMKRNKNINHKNNNDNNNNNNNNRSQSTITKKKKSKSTKGQQWTMEEDRLLIRLVETYGVRKWSQIAHMLKGRIGKQCRERWHNHLRPDIKKDMWTEDEDRILIETHAQVGNKWAEIAKRLPGRTENSIKNHWNATKRRQFTRRKCRTKWPKPSSLLQNYIRSLHFEKASTSNNRSREVTAPVPPNADPVIINSGPSIVPELDFGPADHTVPDYDDFDVFTFDDDDMFDVGSSFMDDIPNNEACFDVELPFDMPPLMQGEVKDGLGAFMG